MLGRWTCHPSIGLVILQLGLRPSFILNIKLGMFLDLHIGTLDLSPQHWTCHLKLGLRPSFNLNTISLLFLDLNVGTLDLSPQLWTCHFEAGPLKLAQREPSAQLHSQHGIMNVSGLAEWLLAGWLAVCFLGCLHTVSL